MINACTEPCKLQKDTERDTISLRLIAVSMKLLGYVRARACIFITKNYYGALKDVWNYHIILPRRGINVFAGLVDVLETILVIIYIYCCNLVLDLKLCQDSRVYNGFQNRYLKYSLRVKRSEQEGVSMGPDLFIDQMRYFSS